MLVSVDPELAVLVVAGMVLGGKETGARVWAVQGWASLELA